MTALWISVFLQLPLADSDRQFNSTHARTPHVHARTHARTHARDNGGAVA